MVETGREGGAPRERASRKCAGPTRGRARELSACERRIPGASQGVSMNGGGGQREGAARYPQRKFGDSGDRRHFPILPVGPMG